MLEFQHAFAVTCLSVLERCCIPGVRPQPPNGLQKVWRCNLQSLPPSSSDLVLAFSVTSEYFSLTDMQIDVNYMLKLQLKWPCKTKRPLLFSAATGLTVVKDACLAQVLEASFKNFQLDKRHICLKTRCHSGPTLDNAGLCPKTISKNDNITWK